MMDGVYGVSVWVLSHVNETRQVERTGRDCSQPEEAASDLSSWGAHLKQAAAAGGAIKTKALLLGEAICAVPTT